MEWLRENWFWLAVTALFVWMHLKMHGGHGHGGHGGHEAGHRRPPREDGTPAANDRPGIERTGGNHAEQ